MMATIYRDDVTHFACGDYVKCGGCEALFYDDNVGGLHAVWLYCPYCGLRLVAQGAA